MKSLIFRLLYLLQIPALFRFLHRNTLTIVLYHGVAPKVDQGIYNYRGKFITPESFEAHMQYLSKHYTILSIDDAVQRMGADTLPKYSLAITFDDGYRNFYDYAFPVLGRMNIPATMYLATDFVCRKIPLWVDRLEYAIGSREGSLPERIALDSETRDSLKKLDSAKRELILQEIERASSVKFSDFSANRAPYAPLESVQIHELGKSGVTFGAHTKSHPILAKLERGAQREEIEGSRRDLEAAGVRVSAVFAYPNGQADDWTRETEDILKDTGYTHSLTTLEGTNTARTHPYRLHRMTIDATEDLALFANVVSGVRSFLKSMLV